MAREKQPRQSEVCQRMDPERLAACERAVGYVFKNRALLEEALTHPSYSLAAKHTVPSNQRLEFLGDAVVGLALAGWIHREFPAAREGEMTRVRAGLARAGALARVAEHLGIEAHLRSGAVGSAERVAGRERALSDALEALAAAVFLDAGFEAASRHLQRWFRDAGLDPASGEAPVANPKGALQEALQPTLGNSCVRYEVTASEGPDHSRRFTVNVIVQGEVWGTGSGDSKKAAEESAAREALRRAPGARPRALRDGS